MSVLLVLFAAVLFVGFSHYTELKGLYDFQRGKLSNEVLAHTDQVSYYANEYGISEYVPTLLAIMEVESSGLGEDVMQSSESLGLSPNSLMKEESIRQGCAYFAELLDHATQEGTDTATAIQAYNYGAGFIDYVAENGGHYTYDLAEAYARSQSDGEKVKYYNSLAFKENGGWRYNYGNMYYVRLVSRFL